MKAPNTVTQREEKLKTDFNNFWNDNLRCNKNYYDNLGIIGILRLKNILSDINNIITLKTTLCFVKKISELFPIVFKDIKNIVDEKEPNSNGFDLIIDVGNNKILAEVKCNIPCGKRKKSKTQNSDTFGSKQKYGIITDIENLLSGKDVVDNPELYYKFMVLLETGTVQSAMDNLINMESKGGQEGSLGSRIKNIKNSIVVTNSSDTLTSLKKEKVYGVYITTNEINNHKDET